MLGAMSHIRKSLEYDIKKINKNCFRHAWLPECEELTFRDYDNNLFEPTKKQRNASCAMQYELSYAVIDTVLLLIVNLSFQKF